MGGSDPKFHRPKVLEFTVSPLADRTLPNRIAQSALHHNVKGLLTEGFFWIPSLAGPTTIAARQNGSGISWLFPFVDGHPPLGWPDTLAYIVLPVLLVLSQYISVQIMQSSQANDPNMKSSQAITKFLPLMIGYFSLSVPSGLSLYWFTNNILSTVQQVWLQKLGGAKNPGSKFSDTIIKEEPSQTQKPVIESNTIYPKKVIESSTIKKELQGEKLTSDGLRPGERFKQLKEQEARRRRQREEEKRKAEEAAAIAAQMNGGHKKEAGSSDSMNGSGNAFSGITNSSGTEHHSVQADISILDSKEDQKTSIVEKESDEHSSNCKDGTGEARLHENAEKEEAVAAMGTTGYKPSGEDMHRDRSE